MRTGILIIVASLLMSSILFAEEQDSQPQAYGWIDEDFSFSQIDEETLLVGTVIGNLTYTIVETDEANHRFLVKCKEWDEMYLPPTDFFK